MPALVALRCPHCRQSLAQEGRTLRCVGGHTFDIARHGHVTLLAGGGRTAPGDDAVMVAARERVLGAGHLDEVTAALVRAARAAAPPTGVVVEVGAGTGHHLSALLEALPGREGIALDLSRYAARRAARRPNVAAVVADAWRPWPVADASACLVLSVFAPRNPAESRRVLRPGGAAIVATPTPAHLAELVDALGLVTVPAGKAADLRADHRPLEAVSATAVSAVLTVDHATVADLVMMGPSRHHVAEEELAARISALPELVDVTVAVEVTTLAADR